MRMKVKTLKDFDFKLVFLFIFFSFFILKRIVLIGFDDWFLFDFLR